MTRVHKVKGCTFLVTNPDIDLKTLGKKSHRQSFSTRTSQTTIDCTTLAYLKWKYPKDKTLSECGSTFKRVKDGEYIRYIDFKLTTSGRAGEIYRVEIPHWNFNGGIL